MRFGGDWTPQSSSENMTGFLEKMLFLTTILSFIDAEQLNCDLPIH